MTDTTDTGRRVGAVARRAASVAVSAGRKLAGRIRGATGRATHPGRRVPGADRRGRVATVAPVWRVPDRVSSPAAVPVDTVAAGRMAAGAPAAAPYPRRGTVARAHDRRPVGPVAPELGACPGPVDRRTVTAGHGAPGAGTAGGGAQARGTVAGSELAGERVTASGERDQSRTGVRSFGGFEQVFERLIGHRTCVRTEGGMGIGNPSKQANPQDPHQPDPGDPAASSDSQPDPRETQGVAGAADILATWSTGVQR